MTNKIIILLLLVFTVQIGTAEDISIEDTIRILIECKNLGKNWNNFVARHSYSSEKAWDWLSKRTTDSQKKAVAICMSSVPHYFTRYDDVPPQHLLHLPDRSKR